MNIGFGQPNTKYKNNWIIKKTNDVYKMVTNNQKENR